MNDLLGNALLDWHNGIKNHPLFIGNNYGEPDEMPIDYYFRTEDELPDIERLALEKCKGEIADIGAGVGCHSLILQEQNKPVVSFEISPILCDIMQSRGVKSVECANAFTHVPQQKFDTLLLLMNGIGIAGDIEGLTKLLHHLKKWIKKDGQIIFDSSDISYLYEDENKPTKNYFGEIDYQYQYRSKNGDWFKWLYIDFDTLTEVAHACGYDAYKLAEDSQDHYLCRLTMQ